MLLADKTRNPSVVMLTTDREIDRRITLEADSLEAAGWDVTIVAMPQDHARSETDGRVVRLGSGTVAAGHRTRSSQPIALTAYRCLHKVLPTHLKFVVTAKSWTWQYIDYEKFYSALFLQTALRFRPTVFLAHNLPMLPVALAAARATGSRLAYDSHELFTEQMLSPRVKDRWKAIENKYIGQADLLLTINKPIAEELTRRYAPENEIHVVMNAENPLPLQAHEELLRDRLKLSKDDRLLLFQGGLSANRNLHTIVEAIGLIKHPAIHLVFLGNGNQRKSLSAIAQKNKTTSQVHFLDAVPQDQLLRYSASADLGVIPYQSTCLNNHLCTPNKLFEFIAAGVPILASDLPELRRIVVDNDIGMVADFSNPSRAADAISAAFVDKGTLQRWKANVLAVQSRLNWHVEGEKFVTHFEKLR